MEGPSLYAIGAFIQALGQNLGLEALLPQLGSQAQVYIGTGLGAVVDACYQASIHLYRTQKRWDAFLGKTRLTIRRWLLIRQTESTGRGGRAPLTRIASCRAARRRSCCLERLLDEARSPESLNGIWPKPQRSTISASKGISRHWRVKLKYPAGKKQAQNARLQEKVGIAGTAVEGIGTPDLEHLQYLLYASLHSRQNHRTCFRARRRLLHVGGVALRLAMKAIQTGDAKAVVIGATDPAPASIHCRLILRSAQCCREGRRLVQLSTWQLQGTHISGGSVVWIVGDMGVHEGERFPKPLGMWNSTIAVCVSSGCAPHHHAVDGGPNVGDRAGARRSARASPGDRNMGYPRNGTPWDHRRHLQPSACSFPASCW